MAAVEVVRRLLSRIPRLPKPARRLLTAVLIVAVTEFIVDGVQPFGVGEAIKARAAVVMQKVISPFYGGLGGQQDGAKAGEKTIKVTRGQQAVTVVLIDETYFTMTHPGEKDVRPVWPLPVANLTSLIRTIVEAEPTALFVDIALPDAPREISEGSKNSRAEALEQLASRLRGLDSSTPIFMSDVIRPSPDQELRNAGCEHVFIPQGDIESSSVLPRGLTGPLFSASGRAPGLAVVNSASIDDDGAYHLGAALVGAPDTCRNLAVEGRDFIASPALALFDAYVKRCRAPSPPASCLDDPKPAPFRRPRHALIEKAAVEIAPRGALDAHGLDRYALSEAFQAPMSLVWGVRLSSPMRDAFKTAAGADRCANQFFDKPWDPALFYLASMATPVDRALDERQARRCTYIDKISAADLFDQRRYADAAQTESKPSMAQRFIKDRIVLLGASVPQAQDRFASPINGDLPGVYVHAAAVENLITSGDRFRRAKPDRGSWALGFLVSVLLIASMKAAWNWLCERLAPVAAPYGEFVLAPVVYAGLMVAVGAIAICALWFGTTLPMTELAAPVIALHVILFGGYVERLGERLKRFFRDDDDDKETKAPAPQAAPPATAPVEEAAGG